MKGLALCGPCLAVWPHVELPSSTCVSFCYSELTYSFHLGPTYYNPQDTGVSLKYPVGNRKLLKGRQQQSDSKCVVKIFILFVGFEKGNRNQLL